MIKRNLKWIIIGYVIIITSLTFYNYDKDFRELKENDSAFDSYLNNVSSGLGYDFTTKDEDIKLKANNEIVANLYASMEIYSKTTYSETFGNDLYLSLDYLYNSMNNYEEKTTILYQKKNDIYKAFKEVVKDVFMNEKNKENLDALRNEIEIVRNYGNTN